jgi:hypothetical protein
MISKATTILSRNLKTKVSLKHVNLSFFNKLSLEGLLVEDKKQDTLVYAGTASVNITDWFFFKDNATLKFIGLTDAIVNINRTDSSGITSSWSTIFPIRKKNLPIQEELILTCRY